MEFLIESKLVSVVIPAYNVAPYIKQAIESVLSQDCSDYEIIVVDDGSTDDTPAIAQQFGNSIRYIRQTNQGLSAARNTGIKTATGKFISLLDSDDLYETSFLATLIKILDNNSAIDAVYCSARTVDQNNQSLPQIIGKALLPNQFHSALLKGGFFPPSCMVAHSYCYKSEERFFDESLHRVEDLDLWLKFAQYYEVLGTDYPLVRYRILPQSLSTDPKMVLEHRIEVIKRHYSIMGENSLPIQMNEAIGRSHIAAAIEYLQLHNLEQAFLQILEGFCNASELIFDFGIYYELALGDQPRGYRGDFSTLNLNYNISTLFGLLDRLFLDSKLAQYKGSLEHKAYANANKAFGILAYGARNFPIARLYFLRAVMLNPMLVIENQFSTRIMKSLLPSRFIDTLKVFYKSLLTNHSQ